MPHFHIRWSNSELDWEAFPTVEEAQAQAEQLVRLGETYVIEQLNGDCPRCSALNADKVDGLGRASGALPPLENSKRRVN